MPPRPKSGRSAPLLVSHQPDREGSASSPLTSPGSSGRSDQVGSTPTPVAPVPSVGDRLPGDRQLPSQLSVHRLRSVRRSLQPMASEYIGPHNQAANRTGSADGARVQVKRRIGVRANGGATTANKEGWWKHRRPLLRRYSDDSDGEPTPRSGRGGVVGARRPRWSTTLSLVGSICATTTPSW